MSFLGSVFVFSFVIPSYFGFSGFQNPGQRSKYRPILNFVLSSTVIVILTLFKESDA